MRAVLVALLAGLAAGPVVGEQRKLSRADRPKLEAFDREVEKERKARRPALEADVRRLQVEVASAPADSNRLPLLEQQLHAAKAMLDDHALIVPSIDFEDLRVGFIGTLNSATHRSRHQALALKDGVRHESWEFTTGGRPNRLSVTAIITLRPDLPDDSPRRMAPTLNGNCYEITAIKPGKSVKDGMIRANVMEVRQVDPNELWAAIIELRKQRAETAEKRKAKPAPKPKKPAAKKPADVDAELDKIPPDRPNK